MSSQWSSAAGLSSQASISFAHAYLHVEDSKRKLSLRGGPGSPCVRSFRFSGASSTGGFDPMHPDDRTAVPGSPRSSHTALRGLPAGKLVEVIRAGRPLVWSHTRGSTEGLTGISRSPSRSTSPRESRWSQPSRRKSPGGSTRASGRTSLHNGELGDGAAAALARAAEAQQAALHANAIALAAAAVAAAAAAETEAERSAWAAGSPSGSRAAAWAERWPLPRQGEGSRGGSCWRQGLSPRTAERGASRLFPCHLVKPHARVAGGELGGTAAAPRVSSEGHAASTATLVMAGKVNTLASGCSVGTCDSSSPTVIGPPSLEVPFRRLIAPSDSDGGCSADVAAVSCGSTPAASPVGSPRQLMRAAPPSGGLSAASPRGRGGGRGSATTRPGTSPAQRRGAKPRPAAVVAREDESYAKGKDPLVGKGCKVLGGSPMSGSAGRLNELRGKLEQSLRAAEDGLSSHVKLLDRRLQGPQSLGSFSSGTTLSSIGK